MKIHNNTILITGGSSGIGLALAKAFVQANNTVIICGRSEEKLQAAKNFVPVQTYACDLAHEAERRSLVTWVKNEFPSLNILINNAGIQRHINLKNGLAALNGNQDEVAINLEAPIWLTLAFMPHLLARPQAAIVNISSGLAYVPMARTPIYCATKAALHSFSQSLRYQLQDTSLQVFEVIPPAVDTNLDQGIRKERGSKVPMISPKVVAEKTLQGLARDVSEIRIDKVQLLYYLSRFLPKRSLNILNRLST
jgi:uncharacterized oxidoreductase